jgi:hypothetical protein
MSARIVEAIRDQMLHALPAHVGVIDGPGGCLAFIGPPASSGLPHHDTNDTKSMKPDIRTIPMRVRVAVRLPKR